MADGTGEPREPVERLEALLAATEKRGLRSLSDGDLVEFGRLYRRASSALSRARSHGLEGAEAERLNRLVGRAYAQIYVGEPRRVGTLRRFFLREFPRTFRRHVLFFLAAVGIFGASGGLGWGLTTVDPGMPDVVIGPGWAEELDGLAERHVGVKNWLPEEARPMASSFIMTNNIKVSFLAFGTGVLFGLGTVYVMVFNGFIIGTVGAVIRRHGVDANFWGFVAPHGVIELTAIFIAGGAGLMLGYALLRPGDYGRLDSLKRAASEAIKLIMGIAAMLVVAGVIEAFISPLPDVPPALKFQFAAVVGAAQFAYLSLAGREAAGQGDKATRRQGDKEKG